MDNFTFCPLIILENGTVFCDGKLRMVIWNHWNVSERQQPDRIAENRQKSPTGLHHSKKILYHKASLIV